MPLPRDHSANEIPHSTVDTKLPLTWLITSGGVITVFLATTLWSVAMQSNKLDQLVSSTGKIEVNVAAQDGRLDKLKENAYGTQRIIDNQQLRIEALERVTRK